MCLIPLFSERTWSKTALTRIEVFYNTCDIISAVPKVKRFAFMHCQRQAPVLSSSCIQHRPVVQFITFTQSNVWTEFVQEAPKNTAENTARGQQEEKRHEWNKQLKTPTSPCYGLLHTSSSNMPPHNAVPKVTCSAQSHMRQSSTLQEVLALAGTPGLLAGLDGLICLLQRKLLACIPPPSSP